MSRVLRTGTLVPTCCIQGGKINKELFSHLVPLCGALEKLCFSGCLTFVYFSHEEFIFLVVSSTSILLKSGKVVITNK